MARKWMTRLILSVLLLASFHAAVYAEETDNWYDNTQEEFFWEQQDQLEQQEQEQPQQPVFPDVTSGNWYYDAVMNLYEGGIIGGFPDGTFKPEQKVTTGQALKMIILAAGYPEPETAPSHWARGYLNFALEQGFLERGEITDLDVNMSRKLTAKVAALALGVTRSQTQQLFTDTDDDYTHALAEIGVIDGYPDGTFRPNGSLTRAELSAIVSRIYNYRAAQKPGAEDDLINNDEPIVLRTTEDGVAFIKAREGFVEKAYWDYSQYSIGYGSYCEKDDYPDGITQEQADRLLRVRLKEFEEKLDAFLEKNRITLRDNQYDALMSFTYNNGAYWMDEKKPTRIASLLISGNYTVNEFASAYGIWCHVSSADIHMGLIERRIYELKLFFNGDYNARNTDGFNYVLFQTQKGSVEVDVAVYETGSYYDPMFEAYCDDDEFAGWVTEAGEVIDENSRVQENLTLTALWRSESAEEDW